MCDYRQSQIPTQGVNELICNQNEAELSDKKEGTWAKLLPVGSAFSGVGNQTNNKEKAKKR